MQKATEFSVIPENSPPNIASETSVNPPKTPAVNPFPTTDITIPAKAARATLMAKGKERHHSYDPQDQGIFSRNWPGGQPHRRTGESGRKAAGQGAPDF